MGKHAERRLLNVFAEKLPPATREDKFKVPFATLTSPKKTLHGVSKLALRKGVELPCENIPIFLQRSKMIKSALVSV